MNRLAAGRVGGKVIATITTDQGERFRVRNAAMHDADGILTIVNAEHARNGSLLMLGPATLQAWINEGRSFVVADPISGKIAAHMAVDSWSGSFEIRSVVTAAEYRNKGINSQMTQVVIEEMFRQFPDATLVEVKNDASNGHAVLITKFGFENISADEAAKLGVELHDRSQKWHIYALTLDKYATHKMKGALRHASEGIPMAEMPAARL